MGDHGAEENGDTTYSSTEDWLKMPGYEFAIATKDSNATTRKIIMTWGTKTNLQTGLKLKKSRIRETLNILTDADHRTNIYF